MLERRGDFEVTVGQSAGTAPLSGLRAGYWDWGFARYDERGQLQSHMTGERHEGPVALSDGGEEAMLRSNQLRLYLEPSFRLTVAPGDADLPAPIAAWLEKYRTAWDEPWLVEEYVLEAGRRYHARVRVERYALPPFGPFPRSGENPVLHLSDRPFGEWPEDAEPIPSFHGFTY